MAATTSTSSNLGNRPKIRTLPPRQIRERDVLFTLPRHLPARGDPTPVSVDQYLHQRTHVIRRLPRRVLVLPVQAPPPSFSTISSNDRAQCTAGSSRCGLGPNISPWLEYSLGAILYLCLLRGGTRGSLVRSSRIVLRSTKVNDQTSPSSQSTDSARATGIAR